MVRKINNGRDVRRLLISLGNSSEEIHRSLSAQKITGKRHSAYSCPVANYLSSMGLRHPAVAPGHISGYIDSGYIDNHFVEMLPMETITCFILDFDDGKYQDLEEI